MKKLATVFLVLLLCLGITACSSKTSSRDLSNEEVNDINMMLEDVFKNESVLNSIHYIHIIEGDNIYIKDYITSAPEKADTDKAYDIKISTENSKNNKKVYIYLRFFIKDGKLKYDHEIMMHHDRRIFTDEDGIKSEYRDIDSDVIYEKIAKYY